MPALRHLPLPVHHRTHWAIRRSVPLSLPLTRRRSRRMASLASCSVMVPSETSHVQESGDEQQYRIVSPPWLQFHVDAPRRCPSPKLLPNGEQLYSNSTQSGLITPNRTPNRPKNVLRQIHKVEAIRRRARLRSKHSLWPSGPLGWPIGASTLEPLSVRHIVLTEPELGHPGGTPSQKTSSKIAKAGYLFSASCSLWKSLSEYTCFLGLFA
jgi:hypothetical protein